MINFSPHPSGPLLSSCPFELSSTLFQCPDVICPEVEKILDNINPSRTNLPNWGHEMYDLLSTLSLAHHYLKHSLPDLCSGKEKTRDPRALGAS